ncbi:TetR/AcrR family transcriptional regulator [Nocardiopsis alba]|uniref:TetR/AcrR family transcriptional regulator n=1 Tax=Nocardiopsis alba TaxID=53437 RepID=UPI0033FF0BCA
MPRTPEQHRAMRAATRERVRTAAIRLFCRRGYAGVDMRAIAAEAGISTGSIYRHFATKDELYDDLVAEAATGLRALARSFTDTDLVVEPLRGFVEVFLADLSRDTGAVEFYLLMNQVFASGVEAGPERGAAVEDLLRAHREVTGAVVTLIERGRGRGLTRPAPAAELATCFFATLGGLAMTRSALGEAFVAPSVATVTGILLVEETTV